MRYRRQSSLVPFHMGYEMISNGTVSNNYGTFLPGYGRVKDFWDEVTPNFRTRIARGEYIVNSLKSLETITYGTHTSGFRHRYNVDGREWYSTGNLLPSLISSVDSTFPTAGNHMASLFSNAAREDLGDEICTAVLAKRGTLNVNNFENIGQMSQTINELRNPFKNFALWSSRWSRKQGLYKRQSKTGIYLTPENVFNLWLQYRYGVRLLIKDVQEVWKELDTVDKSRTITSRETRSIKTSSVQSKDVQFGVGIWTFRIEKAEEFKARAMSIDEVQLELRDKLGLSTKSLLVTPWELIPYSFVADWFVNVQEFLSASVPTPQAQTLASCHSSIRTTIATISTSSQRMAPGNNDKTWLANYSGSHTIVTTEKMRTPGLRSPALVIKGDFGFDRFQRVADAVSLAAVAYKDLWGPRGIINNLLMAKPSRK